MQDTLLSRETELEHLEDQWSKTNVGESSFVIIGGSRRIGKTFLVQNFSTGKRSIYYSCVGDKEGRELGRLFANCSQTFASEAMSLTGGNFTSWESAFDFIGAQATTEPLLFIIDEFTMLLEHTPGFTAYLRNFWDKLSNDPRRRLMIILLDSVLTQIEKELQHDAPLYGRPTLNLKMKPIPFHKSSPFLPHLSEINLLYAYSACGGYPLHLKRWQEDSTLEENLVSLAGTPASILLESANFLISNHRQYEPFLRAIGSERISYNKLKNRVEKDFQYISGNLERAGTIVRETPAGTPIEDTKKRLYRINDPYLRFWYSIISSHSNEIEGSLGRKVILNHMDVFRHHVAAVFEDECRNKTLRLIGADVFPYCQVGRWWGNKKLPNRHENKELEIDVAGVLPKDEFKIVGEATMQSSKIEHIADEVSTKSDIVAPDKSIEKLIFVADLTNKKMNGFHIFGIDDIASN